MHTPLAAASCSGGVVQAWRLLVLRRAVVGVAAHASVWPQQFDT